MVLLTRQPYPSVQVEDPAHPEFGLIGRINQDVDAEFLESNINRRKARRRCETAGRNFLYEYACSDDSIIGQVAEQIGVKCVRLTRNLLDLEKAEDVQQACGQLEEVPGADVWVSIACTHFSPLQHLNEAVHGASFTKKLKKAQSKLIKMLLLALPFLELAMSNNGRIAVELPRSNGLWDTVEWKTFMAKHNLKYVHFDGCALNLQGKSGKFLRKPWTIATNDLSILQYF